ncbi:MAG: ATP-binding protein [Candidatus Tyrphobacter sp.]
MSISTNLHGRLRNTHLPLVHCMLPVFEAVVNSIHSVSDLGPDKKGWVELRIIREPQQVLHLDKPRRGAQPMENIADFEVVDSGIGFNDANLDSFKTLDTEYKANVGGRGVGRLLWLKAFERAIISSVFLDEKGLPQRRRFAFTPTDGVGDVETDTVAGALETSVRLQSFKSEYRERAPKGAPAIANALLEHCLFYFVRAGGAPKMTVVDGADRIDMMEVYENYMHASSKEERVEIAGQHFDLTHIKLKSSAQKQHFIAWCAANRVVEEEPITGKVPGLHGKIKDGDGEFVYACYVTSEYLDENVRPERIGFDIPQTNNELFSQTGPSMTDIDNAVMESVVGYLDEYLQDLKNAGRTRIENYVAHQAARYRPILGYVREEELWVDPAISDKDLDVLLHEKWFDLERSLIAEGHEILKFSPTETVDDYGARIANYVQKVDDIKRSDLANYVSHRKVVLEIIERAVQLRSDGKYQREDLIHQLIVPMRKTSNEVRMDDCNLWLIDERLAFHNYLASDKPIKSMPIVNSGDGKKPDICILDVMDQPLLVSEKTIPATLTIVELKRPMRADVGSNDEDPIAQSLDYLRRIRAGEVTTAAGRPIPNAGDIPGFCYVVCDLTPQMILCCEKNDLKRTPDGMGYFRFHDTYRAYIEVISFDAMIQGAKERNRAFFDRLGLPTD